MSASRIRCSQPDGVITTMRLIEMGLPAVAYIGALALLMFCPLAETKMGEVQELNPSNTNEIL
jgi:Na+/melibiose symporter-like transporter